MSLDFFVMLNTQSGGIVPLVTGDDGDELAVFETEAAATEAARNNLLGEHFGFEVFERGIGTSH